ncbi:hypothetical protein GJ744_005446 [Endocarpon pusillum]|uniref:Uncharacterized protein n=1 Tax=Endocarpon pusillum TaxID=364733 RepID=A0A8H7A4P9_9EURO|nr:hypothetical protein GJ744_005446 [Endocarpon pusillum]
MYIDSWNFQRHLYKYGVERPTFGKLFGGWSLQFLPRSRLFNRLRQAYKPLIASWLAGWLPLCTCVRGTPPELRNTTYAWPSLGLWMPYGEGKRCRSGRPTIPTRCRQKLPQHPLPIF